MKKVMVSLATLTLILALVISGGPALAVPLGNTPNNTPVKPQVTSSIVRGVVNAVSSNTLTVGNTDISVVPTTIYQVPGINNATLSDIQVGMNVTAQTEKINGQAYAVIINVIPVVRHYVGNVTAYTYDPANGGSISIIDKDDKTYSFHIVASEFTILPQGTVVQAGEHVTVTTQQASVGDAPVAIGIFITIPLEHFSGNVTAFSYNPGNGGSISVEEKGGTILTFAILTDKFAIQPTGTDVTVGSHVTVTVQGGSQPVAIGVNVVIPTEHFVGNVTAYNYDPANGGKISIVGQDGKNFNFDIAAGNFTIQPTGTNVNVGDTVTVVAKVMDGENLLAVGVVVQPKSVTIKGTITNIDQTGKTITIGTTVVSYNAKTVFVLHGTPSVSTGLQATAVGYEQPDRTVLAGSIAATMGH